jgi:hypothetical protein
MFRNTRTIRKVSAAFKFAKEKSSGGSLTVIKRLLLIDLYSKGSTSEV